ncbi:MAG: IS1634 family transposase [Planctomycetota bacterium]
MKHSEVKGHSYDYLQIVQSAREGAKVRQKVVANLGRLDQLLESGQLDRIVNGLAQYSRAYDLYRAFVEGRFSSCLTRTWGPALVFGRLWERQGLPRILRGLASDRKFEFDIERACFALALQRLCHPGSDLEGSAWLATVECPGFSELKLHQLYRTCSFLAGVREKLETELFLKDRDLLNRELDLVFLDTTSTFIYRDEETEVFKRGYSRDHRPDQPQVMLCVAVDRRGWPIAWEFFPGNTADRGSFRQVITSLRGRFRIREVTVVADRGMISAKNIELLEEEPAPYTYVLGCRMRKQKEVSEEVLSRAGRYQVVADNLEVKDVMVDERRYVVCLNRDEAKRDALAREAILEKLKVKLAGEGTKDLIGNRGYARFLKKKKDAFEIDEAAVERDARLDGKFVLRTNTDLPTAEVAKSYKGLWRVERTFREEKSTLEMRPLYHHRDENRIGHIVASFLALRLEVDLQRRLDERGMDIPWLDVLRDLGRVQAVDLELEGGRFRIRTDLIGRAPLLFAAAGVRPPPRLWAPEGL